MSDPIKNLLKSKVIEVSVPCRIDMGGTLDISTFYYPLRHLNPCTLNIAIDLRTRVRLLPYSKKMIRISSTGFESAEYPLEAVPFRHPLGLMFSVAAYFRVEGVHIEIDSASPPRSALGGSSAAAVALVAAFSKAFESVGKDRLLSRQKIAILAHQLEASVAGVPCGLQDQLAAVFGGVNAWYWSADIRKPIFKKKVIIKRQFLNTFEDHLLLAYCGVPHESKNINQRWTDQFLRGDRRALWAEIAGCTHRFADALVKWNIQEAVAEMNRETEIRRNLTPDVIDDIGEQLVTAALNHRCGARFTGAGGGGCIWALGEPHDIERLKDEWNSVLSTRTDAKLLNTHIDASGLRIH